MSESSELVPLLTPAPVCGLPVPADTRCVVTVPLQGFQGVVHV